MSYTEDGLRKRPRDPVDFIILGVGLGIVGGILLAVDNETAVIGGIIMLVAANVIGLVGIIGQGVLMGSRAANHEEYLHQLVEAGPGDGEDAS